MKILRSALLPASLLTLAFAAVAVFQPLPFGLAVRLWLVGLAALAATALITAALAPFPRTRVEPIRFRRPPSAAAPRPAGLEEVERAVDFAGWNAADLRRRLRPLLREIAAHRLWSRRGIDLERDPGPARRLVGESAWSLLAASPKGSEGTAGAAVIADAVSHLEAL